MKYLVLIYIDPGLLGSLTKDEFDREMAHCIERAAGLK